MNTEHITLLVTIDGLITAVLYSWKGFFELDTARLKNELQKKINACANR